MYDSLFCCQGKTAHEPGQTHLEFLDQRIVSITLYMGRTVANFPPLALFRL